MINHNNKKRLRSLIIGVLIITLILVAILFASDFINKQRVKVANDRISYLNEVVINRNKLTNALEKLTDDLNEAESLLEIIKSNNEFSLQIDLFEKYLELNQAISNDKEIFELNLSYLKKSKELHEAVNDLINNNEEIKLGQLEEKHGAIILELNNINNQIFEVSKDLEE